jgi:hypothetical protein
VEHLVIYFEHGIQDIIPYSEFIMRIRPSLAEGDMGEYLGDDMAIDGGDAEGVFRCRNARELFELLRDDLKRLPFMDGAKVTLVFGEVESDAPREEFYI